MAFESGKHKFGELEGQIVSFVERGISSERVDFLKSLLTLNGFEVIVAEDKRKSEEDPLTYTVAVSDLKFNPVIYVYQRRLLTKDGRKVTPDYWFQESKKTTPQYWEE